MVSVITPSLHQASFIGDTRESVLGQTAARIEYLVPVERLLQEYLQPEEVKIGVCGNTFAACAFL